MDVKWRLSVIALLQFVVTGHGIDDLVVNVNTRRWLYFVPERFLSMTIDPFTLAFSSPLSQETLNMAKGLSPSFVRLGGLGTSSLTFGETATGRSSDASNVTVNAEAWDSIVRFAKSSGLDVIVSLNPGPRHLDGSWNQKNTRDILKYSNRKYYDVSWQFGYDIQTINSTGTEIGRDVTSLRSMLDKLSHYRYATVFPPDVTSLSDFKKIQTVKDMLQKTGDDIVSVILQPKFEDNPDNPELQISAMLDIMDNYVWNKDSLRMTRVPKKPFWIAEPKPSDGSFEDAMMLMKRLGAAAKLGCQVYLRNPGIKSLKSPTPEFWLALLYKNLVGQGVLETKVLSGTRTDVQMFSHCTPSLPEDRTVLNTGYTYEKGAITVFGVNDSPDSIRVALKTGAKEEKIHVYLLSSGEGISANKTEITLFNGQQLTLSPTWELPVLTPKISKPLGTPSAAPTTAYEPVTGQGVIIPGKSIFFLVMPDSRVRTCSVSPVGPPADVSIAEWTKRLRVTTEEPQNTLESTPEAMDDAVEEREPLEYVSFTRNKRPEKEAKSLKNLETRYKTLAKPNKKKQEVKIEDDDDVPVKYIMINENGWLNKLTEKLKAEGLHKPDSAEQSDEAPKMTASTESSDVQIPALKNNPRAKRSSNEAPPNIKPEEETEIKSEPEAVPISPTLSDVDKEKESAEEDKSPNESSEENKNDSDSEILLDAVKSDDANKSDPREEGQVDSPKVTPDVEPPAIKTSPDSENQRAIEHIMSLITTAEDKLLENKTASPESVGKTVEAGNDGPFFELPLKNNQSVYIPVDTRNGVETPATRTLLDSQVPEIPIDNVESSAKVMRQIGGKSTKLSIPIDSATGAPKAAAKPPPPPPSPEKLKEMRAKYAENLKIRLTALRAKMIETREKLQQELRKSSKEETLKSKIRKREEELKDWFRKLDKRETLVSANEAPPSLYLDEEAPLDRSNHKRSTPKPDEKPVEKKPVLFPLNVKTQGIVYNNKIYPAKLFGIIELPAGDTSDDYSVKYSYNKRDYIDDDYDDLSAAEPPAKHLKIPNDVDPDSPYVPVVILSPNKRDNVDLKKSPESDDTRVKRSTFSERIAQLKETLFPDKLFESIKREIKPWTRDVRSSRTRRHIGLGAEDDAAPTWWANEIRPRLMTSDPIPLRRDEGVEIGKCEEIGTSKESLIKEGDVIRGGQGESDESLAQLLLRTMVDKMKSIVSLMKVLKEWSPLESIGQQQP